MSPSQNQEQLNSHPIKEVSFKLKNQKGQNSIVKLILMNSEFICIQVLLSRSCWEITLNQSSTLKIHNVFFLSNSTEELFSYFEDSINAKQVSLETVESLAHLTFNQVFMNKPIVFKITLKSIEMNLQQIIQEMSSEFEEKFLQDDTKINQLEEEMQKRQFKYPFSEILKGDEKDMIYKWVSAGKVVSHLDLLYRASDHGFQAQSFHLRCDGKGPLVCFVRSQNQRRFGGYLHLKFQKNQQKYIAANPNESFLFSLDDKKQYLSNETNCNYAYYSYSSQGFTMGNGHDLYLSDNCNANSSSYSNIPYCYGKNQGGSTSSLAGSYNFLVDEVEVFEVIYKQ